MASASKIWREFVVDGLCGLCGNLGVVTTQVRTGAGARQHFVESYCICPNGRARRKGHGRRKWGGSSVLAHRRSRY